MRYGAEALLAGETHLNPLFTSWRSLKQNRRNNIRIRGLPEATGDCNLIQTLKGIFSQLLCVDMDLEVDTPSSPGFMQY